MFGVTITVLGALALLSPALAREVDYGLPGQPPNSRIVVNNRQCWNTAAFAVTGALEIWTEKLLGEEVKFSEQEIVDCHYSGCDELNAPSVDDILHWLRVQQRLARDTEYPEFSGKTDNDGNTCRASNAPNALQLNIGSTVVVDDLFLTVESALDMYGSIFARINTSPEFCPGYLKTKAQIDETSKTQYVKIYQDNNEDGFLDGYMEWFTGEDGHVISGGDKPTEVSHNVLIVGLYTDDTNGKQYYIVRDSRGDAWMRRGHFLLERYTNTCGIENSMMAVEAEVNLNAKVGCPDAFPRYCTESLTCTKDDQECVPTKDNTYDFERDAPAKSKDLPDVSDRPECVDTPGYEQMCTESAKVWKNCMSPNIKATCPGSCLVCHRDECKDIEAEGGECANYKKYCNLPVVRAMCSKTCQMHPMDCGTLAENVALLAGKSHHTVGACYAPDIANGVVEVGNDGMIKNGAKLKITCDEGYTLMGEESYCVIQNLFGPDSRLLQECVKTGDESWEGKGGEYNGVKATTSHDTLCSNSKKVAAQGIFDKELPVEFGRAALRGSNVNYCRNYESVGLAPWCFTDSIDPGMFGNQDVSFEGGVDENSVKIPVEKAQLNYCYEQPRCGGGFCESEWFDLLGDLCAFDLTSCYLGSPLQAQAQYEICGKSCCSIELQCPETPVW